MQGEARRGSRAIRRPLILAALVGFALAVVLLVGSGAADVAHAMADLGWALAPITLFHVVPLSLSALSWRALLPDDDRLDIVGVVWIRWLRESVNALLPVASVGGDILAARLAHKRGVAGAQAAACMVVDTTVGAATQLVFVLAGVVLLVTRSTGSATAQAASALLIGLAVFVAAIAAFALLQHRSMFAALVRLAGRVSPGQRLAELADSAKAVDDAIVAAYRRRAALARASLLRLAGWVAGAGEIWLVMQFLGKPLTATDAFILESLGSGVRAAAFIVPGALGAQEGGFVLLGALFGLPASTALAISLSKRVREVALGLPGLLAWQWFEARSILRSKAQARASGGPTLAP